MPSSVTPLARVPPLVVAMRALLPVVAMAPPSMVPPIMCQVPLVSVKVSVLPVLVRVPTMLTLAPELLKLPSPTFVTMPPRLTVALAAAVMVPVLVQAPAAMPRFNVALATALREPWLFQEPAKVGAGPGCRLDDAGSGIGPVDAVDLNRASGDVGVDGALVGEGAVDKAAKLVGVGTNDAILAVNENIGADGKMGSGTLAGPDGVAAAFTEEDAAAAIQGLIAAVEAKVA